MSTYLVALVVSDYGRIQETTRSSGSPVTISVYAPSHAVTSGQAQFALSSAVKLFDHFQAYFRVPYPLPKLDLISVPDFNAGAMENWGLAIFRESALLMAEGNASSSSAAKQRVVLIIAHELAHQWFGNLVTMKWWDDLWLAEGFASWAEYMAVSRIYPQWAMMDQFISSKTLPALRTDALSTSHPVSVPVYDPAEIEAIFDTISYNKVVQAVSLSLAGQFLTHLFRFRQGASILNMLQRVLGEEMMRQGLQLYLERHQYGNADTNDLWLALSAASLNSSHPVDVKVIMDSWTQQLGYPLVTLRRHGNLIHASQKHFILVNGSVAVAAAAQQSTSSSSASGGLGPHTKWYVPLSFTTSAAPYLENQIWMHGKDGQ